MNGSGLRKDVDFTLFSVVDGSTELCLNQDA